MIDLAKIGNMSPFTLNEDMRPPSADQIRKDLEQGLVALKEAGWARGFYMAPCGSVCAMGAVSKALAAEDANWLGVPALEARYFAARNAMQQKAEEITGKSLMSPEQYNDYEATGMSDIEALFEKTIADL